MYVEKYKSILEKATYIGTIPFGYEVEMDDGRMLNVEAVKRSLFHRESYFLSVKKNRYSIFSNEIEGAMTRAEAKEIYKLTKKAYLESQRKRADSFFGEPGR